MTSWGLDCSPAPGMIMMLPRSTSSKKMTDPVLGLLSLEGLITTRLKSISSVNDVSGLGLVYCARKEYEKALEVFQNANDFFGMGNAYVGLGDLNQAESIFKGK